MPKVSDEYRDARRRAILDAALTCFERAGLHGTTTDDIAAEAGLSNGALYRYFDGKAAIVEAIAGERHAQERTLLEAALADPDPRRSVHEFVTQYFAWLADPDELRRRRINVHVWAAALADERLAAIVAEGLAPARDAARTIAAAVDAGELPARVDADALVQVILALVQGFVLQAAWDPAIDVGRYAATCAALLDTYLSEPSAPWSEPSASPQATARAHR
jgi:AcrR family transcriptional regulator